MSLIDNLGMEAGTNRGAPTKTTAKANTEVPLSLMYNQGGLHDVLLAIEALPFAQRVNGSFGQFYQGMREYIEANQERAYYTIQKRLLQAVETAKSQLQGVGIPAAERTILEGIVQHGETYAVLAGENLTTQARVQHA